MKFLKKLVFFTLACILIFAAVGCKKTVYGVYTNIPQGGYSITDKSFKLQGTVDGYVEPQREFENIDTSAYSSRYSRYYSMAADAELIVAADFTQEGAVENYTEFVKEVGKTLDDISKALSPTVTKSDIYNFNNAEAGATVEISKITYEVLQQAIFVYELTEHCYNPALYYNVEAYGFGNAHKYPASPAELPAEETVKSYALLASHFGSIELSVEDGKYFVTKPNVTVEIGEENYSLKLDLGGIGKGYAVDCVDKLFESYGYKFGYFSFGGSSMLVKSNVNTGNYNLSFINPRSITRGTFLTTTVRNEKLSTSGDNEQYYILDGTRYCHVIDPKTGKPVQTGIMSVTIIGGGAAEDDALTTAIMCMGRDKAIEFIREKLTDRRVVFTCE